MMESPSVLMQARSEPKLKFQNIIDYILYYVLYKKIFFKNSKQM